MQLSVWSVLMMAFPLLLCLPVVQTVFLTSSNAGYHQIFRSGAPSRNPMLLNSDDRSVLAGTEGAVMHLRGGVSGMYKPRVISVHDFSGWKNVSDDDSFAADSRMEVAEARRLPEKSQATREKNGVKRVSLARNDVPFSDHEHLIDMLRQNRQLLQSCKSLRSRATDDETRSTLDLRIAELESAWAAYVKVNPTAANWQNVLLRSSESEEEQIRLVPVTFVVECNSTKVGDEIVVSGDVEELGNWRESCTVVLRTDPRTFPKWSTTVLLRASDCVEYKYAIRRREGEDPAAPGILVWEGHMGNRGFKVPRRAHVIEDVLIEAEQVRACPNAPLAPRRSCPDPVLRWTPSGRRWARCGARRDSFGCTAWTPASCSWSPSTPWSSTERPRHPPGPPLRRPRARATSTTASGSRGDAPPPHAAPGPVRPAEPGIPGWRRPRRAGCRWTDAARSAGRRPHWQAACA